MTSPLSGVFTALITPFDDEGSFDKETYAQLVEKQVEAGISGLVPCGTTGESPTLTHEEHDQIVELTVKLADGRVPVFAGTGSNSTAEAVRLSKHAKSVGADGIMVVNPYYNKPTQKGLFLHFEAIASAVDLPVILYNIKGRTGVNLETDTLMKLREACPNIAAVKEASGDLNQMKEVISRADEQFSVLSGDDNLALDLVEMGGHGVISVASNLVPEKMVSMVQTALDGDLTTARALEYDLGILFKALFLETNPIPVKAAMAMMGLCQETYRLPMCPLSSESHRTRIRETLEALGIIETAVA